MYHDPFRFEERKKTFCVSCNVIATCFAPNIKHARVLRGWWIKAQKEIAFFFSLKIGSYRNATKTRNDLTASCFNPLCSSCDMNKSLCLNLCEMRSTRHCSENYNRPPSFWTRTIEIVTVFEVHGPKFEVPFCHWFIQK